ncbi:putative DNA-binding protein ribbon-helix-helix domain-containing protein, partial [Dysosmobacter welbionis]
LALSGKTGQLLRALQLPQIHIHHLRQRLAVPVHGRPGEMGISAIREQPGYQDARPN